MWYYTGAWAAGWIERLKPEPRLTNEQKMAFMEAAGIGRSGDTEGLPQSQMLILPGRTHVGLGMETEVLMPYITPFLDSVVADKFIQMMNQ